jgi:hypothetical protein
MAVQVIPILWPDEDQYGRFQEICGGKLPPTLQAYQVAVTEKIEKNGWSGLVKKIRFDPEDLRAFADSLGEEIHSYVRSRYAHHLWDEAHATKKSSLYD